MPIKTSAAVKEDTFNAQTEVDELVVAESPNEENPNAKTASTECETTGMSINCSGKLQFIEDVLWRFPNETEEPDQDNM